MTYFKKISGVINLKTKFKKLFSAFLTAAVVMSVFTSCSQPADTGSVSESKGESSQVQASVSESSASESSLSENSVSESSSQQPSQSTEVSIVDVVGRTVTLPKPACRLVGTHNPTLNQAVILGGGKYLVGFGNKKMASGLYSYVFPQLDEIPQIGKGKEINFEECLAQKADLAILPERFASLAQQFEDVGIPAAVVLPSTESFDTIRSSLKMVSVLVGDEKHAEEIISYFDKKIKEAEDIAATIEEKPRVLYLGGATPLSVANGVMLQSKMIEAVGGENVAKDVEGTGDFIEISVEEIIKMNPEVIYIPVFAKYSIDDILNDAAWQSVTAVKNKKIFTFPSALEPWDYPTPSAAIGLSWLISNLYPEKYSLDKVVEDANEYYNLVYGQTFTKEQLGL